MSPFDGVNNYYEYKMSEEVSLPVVVKEVGGCLSGCAMIVAAIFACGDCIHYRVFNMTLQNL